MTMTVFALAVTADFKNPVLEAVAGAGCPRADLWWGATEWRVAGCRILLRKGRTGGGAEGSATQDNSDGKKRSEGDFSTKTVPWPSVPDGAGSVGRSGILIVPIGRGVLFLMVNLRL